MRIVCLGGGPPDCILDPDEAGQSCQRHYRYRTQSSGWGIVFSDKTMDGFRRDDPQVVAEIERSFHHWDDVDVFFRAGAWCPAAMASAASGASSCCRSSRPARELGVKLSSRPSSGTDDYSREYDLVIGSDGVNSTTRAKYASHFNPRIDVRRTASSGSAPRSSSTPSPSPSKNAVGLVQLRLPVQREWATFIVETRKKPGSRPASTRWTRPVDHLL